ncbi:hypothetical protein [Nostoc sp. CALU 1950]|uniref:hypothetical protein n=1 Tax=Nostoc sp. CALU 1950 TaxID=3104321 RepID=UPI003EBF9D0E
MSKNTKSQNPEWFRYLSEKEQESLVAGQITNMPDENMPVKSSFFLQQNNIQTMADNTLNFANGDVYSQNTRYISSQFTLGYTIKIRFPNFPLFLNKATNFMRN